MKTDSVSWKLEVLNIVEFNLVNYDKYEGSL